MSIKRIDETIKRGMSRLKTEQKRRSPTTCQNLFSYYARTVREKEREKKK